MEHNTERKKRAKGRTRMMRPDGGYRANEQVHKAKNKYTRKKKRPTRSYEEEYQDDMDALQELDIYEHLDYPDPFE